MSIEVEMRADNIGSKRWFIKGTNILHRENGPAIEKADGTAEWYLNGKLHRENGPAFEHSDGTQYWYLNGLQHREDGPAVEKTDETKQWYLNGKRHRENGPAIEKADGTTEWWVNGKPLDDEQISKLKAKPKPINSFFLLMSGEG